jgi:hypothetical protein
MGRGADGGSRSARGESVGLEAVDSSKVTWTSQRRAAIIRQECLRTSLLCQEDAPVTFLLARLEERRQFSKELSSG